MQTRHNSGFVVALLTPVILAMLTLFVIPIIWNVWMAFHEVTFATVRKAWPFVGTRNFANLLANEVEPRIFYKALGTTVIFTIASVAGQFVIGFGLALLLHQYSRGSQIFRAILVLPWVLSELVVAYIWLFMYQLNGPMTSLLAAFGLGPVKWLSDTSIAIWPVSLTNIWFGAPFTLLMMGAALTTINPETLEAARMDGARPWRILRSIILPLCKPFIVLNLVLITMWTVNIFALPMAMTSGGPANSTTTASLFMYRQAFAFGEFSIGSSVGILLFLFNIVGAVVYVRTQRQSHA
jgi:ABC-type sugar transport system permease subunit